MFGEARCFLSRLSEACERALPQPDLDSLSSRCGHGQMRLKSLVLWNFEESVKAEMNVVRRKSRGRILETGPAVNLGGDGRMKRPSSQSENLE